MVAAFLAAAVPTVATAGGYYLALAQGAISCGVWLRDRLGDDARIADEAWVSGFITGMNAGIGAALGSDKLLQVGRGTDAAGMFSWIDNYCRAHPLDHLARAAETLWDTLNDASMTRPHDRRER